MPDWLRPFLATQAVVWIPLLLGHRMRKLGLIRAARSKGLHTFNLVFIAPVAFALGIWALDRARPDWWWAPLLMTILTGLATALAVWISPRLVPDRAAAGSLMILIPMNNIAYTMAGFLTLLFLPPEAYPYNAILMYPYLLFFFLIWLPLSWHWRHGGGTPLTHAYAAMLLSPFSMTIVGMAAGTALNVWAPPMPAAAFRFLKVAVFVSTTLTMFAIGVRLRFRAIAGWQRLLVWVYLIKFVGQPAVMLALCWIFSVRGLPAAALFIASCMPAGVNAPAIATLNDLDVDLANAGYLWTTLIFMVLVLPFMIAALDLPLFR